jgi:hypothetical protein
MLVVETPSPIATGRSAMFGLPLCDAQGHGDAAASSGGSEPTATVTRRAGRSCRRTPRRDARPSSSHMRT